MGHEQWTVKNRNGEIWGTVTKLIIDPATRQIVSADLLLEKTKRLLRVSWESVEVHDEHIVLVGPEDDLMMIIMHPPETGLPSQVTMEVLAPSACPS